VKKNLTGLTLANRVSCREVKYGFPSASLAQSGGMLGAVLFSFPFRAGG
jgi:hypothetical protein